MVLALVSLSELGELRAQDEGDGAAGGDGALAEVTRAAPRWGIGLDSGLSMSFGNAAPSRDGEPRAGLGAGLSVRRYMGEIFALHGELRYAQKGSRATLFRFAGVDARGTLALDYLEVPLLLEARFFSGGRVVPYVNGGPVVGFALKRRFTADTLGSLAFDQASQFKSFDVGFEVGAGVEFRLGERFGLFVQARGTLGLVDLDESLSTYRSRSLGLGGGVLFRL